MEEVIRELVVGADAGEGSRLQKSSESSSQGRELLQQVLYVAGVSMVVGGCAVLLYMAVFMFKLIHEPRDLALAGFVLDHLGDGAQAVSGTIDGRSIYLRFDPSLLAGVYCILSLAMVTTCATVIRGLISVGLRLMRLDPQAATSQVTPR